MFAISFFHRSVIERNNMKRINSLHTIRKIGHEHDAATDRHKIRMFHKNSPTVRQMNMKGMEWRLMQPFANGFYV